MKKIFKKFFVYLFVFFISMISIKAELSDYTYDEIPEQVYTGKEIKPEVVIKKGETILVENTDYTLTYNNNIKVGQASIDVVGNEANSDLILTLNYKINYKITYNLNGGVNNEKNPTLYDGTSSVKLSKPTREGYTFVNWYLDKKFKKKASTIKKGNVTVYAKWKANTYTVKFNSNGGSGKMANLKKKSYDKSFKLTANKFSKKGAKFIGWNTQKDGSGISYSNKAKVKNLVSKNKATITLYAQWNYINYKINYNLNGGINDENNPDTFTVNSTVQLSNPTKEGYIFKGWFTDSKFKKKFKGIKKGTAKNVTVYAKWYMPVEIKVSETSAGIVNGDSQNFTVTYNGSGTIYCKSANTSVATCGWIKEWNGYNTTLVIYGKGAGSTTITLSDNLNTSPKSITVNVAARKYNINYVLNEGENNSENPLYYYENSSSITLKDPTRYGYEFEGWYEDEALTDRIYSIYSYNKKDITVYAKWKKGFVLGNVEGVGSSYSYGTSSRTYSICSLDSLDVKFKTSSYSDKVEAEYTAKLTKTYNYSSTIQYCYVVLNFYDEDNIKIGSTVVSISGLREGESGIESSFTYLDTNVNYITGSRIDIKAVSKA